MEELPVFEAVLLGALQGVGRIAFAVEVFGEAALGAGEAVEVDKLAGLGVLVPIFLHSRVALQGETLFDAVALAGIEHQEWERAAVDGQAGLVAGFVVGDAVFGLAGGVAIDDGGAVEFEGTKHGFVEVVGVGAGGLSDVGVGMHHGDLGDFFAAFLFAVDRFAMDAHFCVLTSEGTGGGLPAGVGIDLGVEHENFDVEAGGHQTREGLKTDVEHGAVAADAPEGTIVPAHLVPTHADTHGVCGGVFEEGVGPGDEIGIVRIGGSVNRVAAGGGNDAPLVAVFGAGGGTHHA